MERFRRYLDDESSGNKQVKQVHEIPDFLLCRITDDLMKDPVVLESGFTYEREAITKHFQVNGPKDPITL